MTKPRILHVIHSSAFGGGPTMLAVLCQQLAGQFDMEVVCDGQGDMPARVEAAGATVHRMPLTTKWSFAAHILQLAQLVRSRRPDLVQLHGQFAGALGQPALALAGGVRNIYLVQWPSYLDDGGPWSQLRNRMAEKVSCSAADVVVTVSENDRREFIARRLCPPRKIRVIHNAYATDGRATRPATSVTGAVVGFVGRLVDQKGCEYLIEAAPKILARHPSARFVIVGDGPERSRLERMVDELGVRNSVTFAGYQAEPSTLIEGVNVVVIPSIYDPFPLVTLEVMNLGRPVIATSVGGIPEAVEDGRTGLLVPPRDPAAIAQALDRLLSAPALARQMGESGRDRAHRLFNPEMISSQYANLYRELLSASSYAPAVASAARSQEKSDRRKPPRLTRSARKVASP